MKEAGLHSAYIGLGSNVGDKIKNLQRAVDLLNKTEGCRVNKISSIFESKPYGIIEQDNFYNAAAEIKCSLSVKDLFYSLKKIEEDIGRKKRERWGPREIDLDLIFFDDIVYSDDQINVPHKGTAERDFVLMPLNEIAPDYIHPELKRKISDICRDISANNIIGIIPEKISK
jgi:2-amino-4-hydroxy-6-hydroxymethyldihydropteridine diphosphokinase